MFLHTLNHEPELAEKIEADLRQYYNINLSDVFRPGSGVTLRHVLNLVEQLPGESRFMKHVRDDGFAMEEHLLASMLDTLVQIQYQTSIAAAVGAQKEYSKLMRKAPKPLERPTIKPKPKKKYKFLSTRELIDYMNGAKTKKKIAHTPECVASGVNKGGQVINCACPTVEVEKKNR